MNIPKYIDQFVKESERRGIAKNSIDTYKGNLNIFFNHFKLKEHPLHINANDIKDFLGQYAEPNTQRSYHSAIKKMYDICFNQKDKFKYIPYCKKSNKLPIVLSVEEIQKMFTVCENTKHKLILAILYSCGLRVSELIKLKWCNIDRSRMVINILGAKGNKDRQVPLPCNLVSLLEKYWHEYKTKTYILEGQFKDMYSQRSVLEVVKQLANKAGLKKEVWTHLIRHCYGTHQVEAGIDINLIQRVLGHSDVKTTNIYLHTSHNLISKISSPINNIIL